MPRQLLLEVLTQIREIPTARVIVFTGGEPTLRKDLLLEAISLAKETGCITRVVTNGWWARSKESAKALVVRLKEAGLDELNTSYDDYHGPFAPITVIINLVQAALEVGLRVGVGTIKNKDSVYDSDRVRQEVASGLGVDVDKLEEKVFFIDDYPTPTGTGSDLDTSGIAAGNKLDMGCTEVMKTVSIHPNGLVKVCCGHAMFYNPDLTVGNLWEERLPDMLNRGQQNLLYWWIHMLGPKRILEKLGVEGNYSSICHACDVLLRQYREPMLEYIMQHKDDVLLNDVLFSDYIRRAAQVVVKRQGDIERRLRVLP
jgi:hypothetical protein